MQTGFSKTISNPILKLMTELHTEKNFQENTQDEFWK